MYVMVYQNGRMSALIASSSSVARELYSGTLQDTVLHFLDDRLDEMDELDQCVVVDLTEEAGGPYQLRCSVHTLRSVAAGAQPGLWESVFGVLRESCPFRAEEKPN